ncbi:MAG: hypothetical protein HY716_03790 [Planctomycetes bacterium]|nr:hypothetical protein [Planctomycetota bacterium]
MKIHYDGAMRERRACVNCGDPVTGSGPLCADCVPERPPALTARCPQCKRELRWERIARQGRVSAHGVIEMLYSCPGCRGMIDTASWVQRVTKTSQNFL